ncbi:MAG: Uma2 family endonuclease [Anaerolineae bacterium]|nr:Uma2 family endonuclease [Anaerolineae bacterium]
MISTLFDDNPIQNGMALDDYLRLGNDERHEIINGKLLVQPKATPLLHSIVLRDLFIKLYNHVTENHLGDVYQHANFMATKPDDRNWVTMGREPDLLFYANGRLAEYSANTPDNAWRPIELIPDFIIEVLSSTDFYVDIEAKLMNDFQYGVKQIWLINPFHRTTHIYTANSTAIQRFHIEGQLTAPDILPNFTLDLAQIWI